MDPDLERLLSEDEVARTGVEAARVSARARSSRRSAPNSPRAALLDRESVSTISIDPDPSPTLSPTATVKSHAGARCTRSA